MGLHSLTHICTAQLSGSLAPGPPSEALVAPLSEGRTDMTL